MPAISARSRYKKVAEADEKEVETKDIVKGYEYEKGKWITLLDADFEKVEIESTRTIEITDGRKVARILIFRAAVAQFLRIA